jgi:prephenate dehydrogenase
MKIKVIGDGAFGTFLKGLLPTAGFELSDSAAYSVILAVPLSAYQEVAQANLNKHLINVCSVQEPSTDICLKYSDRVTSIHPLFGKNTPADKRFSISCWIHETPEFPEHDEFLRLFSMISNITERDPDGRLITPERHDMLMAQTHARAVSAAMDWKQVVDDAKDVPDNLLPNSFRLLKQFVKTVEDMPKGTVDSIMENPYLPSNLMRTVRGRQPRKE